MSSVLSHTFYFLCETGDGVNCEVRYLRLGWHGRSQARELTYEPSGLPGGIQGFSMADDQDGLVVGPKCLPEDSL